MSTLFSICVGRHFAKDVAFITIATVLHLYTVYPSVDEHGRPLDSTPVGGLITYVSTCDAVELWKLNLYVWQVPQTARLFFGTALEGHRETAHLIDRQAV